jgi:hypothetical protein
MESVVGVPKGGDFLALRATDARGFSGGNLSIPKMIFSFAECSVIRFRAAAD